MGETTETGARPRLRHCTLVALAGERLAMIVGDERFELEQVQGTRDAFLRMKRYLDGRHTLEDIAQRSDVSFGSVRTIVGQLDELGLLRRERPAATIAAADFLERVECSTRMWRAQIGYHRLFGMLERGEASRDLIAGLLLETYHFVRLAPRHVGAAIAHCRDPATAELLCGYLADEYAHHGLIAASVEKLGIPREQIRDAHPVIGTLSLGWFIERYGFVRVLFACFAGAAVSVGLIGSVAHALPWLLVVVFAGGFCVVGGQPAVNALAGQYYPTSLRSTGIGWSLGIGRIGSVLGPLVGGQLIALNWSNDALFHAAAVPVLCSALFVLGLANVTRRRGVDTPRAV
ncbi:MFS transporter [Paraburkholderia sp. Se-20369]|nr:MFS transporter [Paraburkholderia sp. Se-20369]